MVCPVCGGETKIKDVVQHLALNKTYRRKVCKKCGHEFYTIEYKVEPTYNFRRDWTAYYRSNLRKSKVDVNGK